MSSIVYKLTNSKWVAVTDILQMKYCSQLQSAHANNVDSQLVWAMKIIILAVKSTSKERLHYGKVTPVYLGMIYYHQNKPAVIQTICFAEYITTLILVPIKD